MPENVRLDFDNLPLIEAAVRASFSAPTALSYALVNSIAVELKPSFPVLAESQQIEGAPGVDGTQVEFGPGYLPGAVYTGHGSGLSVHVQPRVIVARWSKRPGLIEPEYPRFKALRDSLWNAVEAFRKAREDEFPGIAVVNMSYVNFIPVSDPATVVRTYFAKNAHLGVLENAHQVRKLEAAWSESDDLDLRFALEQAAAKLPEGVTQGYRLTTAAGLRLGKSLSAESGLDRVHDKLQAFFVGLISNEAKSEWKLRDAQNG